MVRGSAYNMPWITRDSREFWIGHHKKIGPVVVADRKTFDQTGETIELFIISQERVAVFKKTAVRHLLGRIDDEAAQEALNSYISILHKSRFIATGRNYPGARASVSAEERETHCFSCKAKLSSKRFLLCLGCQWIICSCGACGCRWHGRDYYR